jgi:WD40 repeat protein
VTRRSLATVVLLTLVVVLAAASLAIYLHGMREPPRASPAARETTTTTVAPTAEPALQNAPASEPSTAPAVTSLPTAPTPTAGPRAGGAAGPTDVREVAFARDGRLVVATSVGEVALVDLATGQRQAMQLRAPAPQAIALSGGGEHVAVAHAGGVAVWHAASATVTPLNADGVQAVAFSPDGRSLATGHAGGDLRLWDAIAWTSLATLRPEVGPIRGIAFAPDARWIAVAGQGAAVWDAAAKRPQAKLAPAVVVADVKFSPDGRLLALASPRGVLLYETTFWGAAATLSTDQPATHLAFWRSGTTIVIATADGAIQLWDLATRQRTATLPPAGPVTSFAVGGDDRTIALVIGGTVTLWDATSRTSRQLPTN